MNNIPTKPLLPKAPGTIPYADTLVLRTGPTTYLEVSYDRDGSYIFQQGEIHRETHEKTDREGE